MYEKCNICGVDNPEPSHFWKTHRMKESDFCITYYPRRNKLTGELIKFKSREFYFEADFDDKNQLKKWVKENPEGAKEYCLDLLLRRKNSGKLKWVPMQTELRSFCSPSVIWYQETFGYDRVADKLGLKKKVKYDNIDKIDLAKVKWDTNKAIIQDTREQLPLCFNGGVEVRIQTLPFGDYYESTGKSPIYIERKSGGDFISTISSGYDRFKREIERSVKAKKYILVLVEESFSRIACFNKLRQYKNFSKASPEFIFYRMRELMQTYDNLQFLFVKNREESSNLILWTYSTEINAQEYDLQYLYDIGRLPISQ